MRQGLAVCRRLGGQVPLMQCALRWPTILLPRLPLHAASVWLFDVSGICVADNKQKCWGPVLPFGRRPSSESTRSLAVLPSKRPPPPLAAVPTPFGVLAYLAVRQVTQTAPVELKTVQLQCTSE